MQLKDPIAIYNSATNLEAQLIANFLNSHEIPAFAVEDASQAGTYSFGLIPEIHKPQVFVDRSNAEEARKLIDEYEDASFEGEEQSDGGTVDYCHACGEHVSRGTPICPACERPLDWSDTEEDESQSATFMSTLKSWKKPAVAVFMFVVLLYVLLGVLL